MPHYYDQYCKYFLVKHNAWRGSIENNWGGPITDPELDDSDTTLEDGNEISQAPYIEKFQYLYKSVDTSQLEMFNLDVDRLFQIRDYLDVLCTEEEEALGENVGSLEMLIQFSAEAPTINNAFVSDALTLLMDTNIN